MIKIDIMYNKQEKFNPIWIKLSSHCVHKIFFTTPEEFQNYINNLTIIGVDICNESKNIVVTIFFKNDNKDYLYHDLCFYPLNNSFILDTPNFFRNITSILNFLINNNIIEKTGIIDYKLTRHTLIQLI